MSGLYRLQWSHGEFVVTTTAAMLADVSFALGGRAFSPFAKADWVDSDLTNRVSGPGHLRALGAEFVGLPFGSSGPPAAISPEWQAAIGSKRNLIDHGLAADAEWTVIEVADGAISLALDYPDHCAVKRIERRISGVAGEPALALSLKVIARRMGTVSVGLHPILRLPERPGALELSAEFAFGLTYPGRLPSGRAVSMPGRRFAALEAVPGPDGDIDLSRLPLGLPVEDNVQLCGMKGPFKAVFVDEGAALLLDWDRAKIPSLMLWFSDRGASDPPFSGRYRGLGIEPIAAAFDLADAVSTGANPINTEGVATSIALDPNHPIEIAYSLSALTTTGIRAI